MITSKPIPLISPSSQYLKMGRNFTSQPISTPRMRIDILVKIKNFITFRSKNSIEGEKMVGVGLEFLC